MREPVTVRIHGHTVVHWRVRRKVVEALKAGRPLGITVKTKLDLVADGSGDTLDAVICAVQAAWAVGQPRYGLPERVPRAEGWIITA